VETGTEREWLTLREVQEMLGIGHTKAFELVTMPGGIPNIGIGKAIRINRRELDDWLERQKYQGVND
jgi:excisionase family DNA binding protein